MIQTPDDKTLFEFVARFAGWMDFDRGPTGTGGPVATRAGMAGRQNAVPNYLRSVDAWLRDVWPKVEALGDQLKFAWLHNLPTPTMDWTQMVNADAKSRCVALWRALDGKLPITNDKPESGDSTTTKPAEGESGHV